VLNVDPQGKVEVKGWKWKISKALVGEWVQLIAIEDRGPRAGLLLCHREIDLRLKPQLRPSARDV